MKNKLKILLGGYLFALFLIACCEKNIPTLNYHISDISYESYRVTDSTCNINLFFQEFDNINYSTNFTFKSLIPIGTANAMTKCPELYYNCKTTFKQVSVTSNSDLMPGFEAGKELNELFFSVGNWGYYPLNSSEFSTYFYNKELEYQIHHLGVQLNTDSITTSTHVFEFTFITSNSDTIKFKTEEINLN